MAQGQDGWGTTNLSGPFPVGTEAGSRAGLLYRFFPSRARKLGGWVILHSLLAGDRRGSIVLLPPRKKTVEGVGNSSEALRARHCWAAWPNLKMDGHKWDQ